MINNTQYCFIKSEYFRKHEGFINMLDSGNISKQSRRTYLCVCVVIGNNNVYVPLRNNLGEPIRKFGKIGFSVPSQKRPNAGLDYRHSLIINDDSYIEYPKSIRLPNSQTSVINANYSVISQEINIYVHKYIKVAKKHREHKEPLFRCSSLMNFHSELGI